MSKGLLRDYLHDLSFQLFAVIAPFVTAPYVSRVLGSEGIGIFSYTHSIALGFVLLASAGINLYGQRTIAYLRDITIDKSNVFFSVWLIKITHSSVCCLVFYLLFCRGGSYSIIFQVLLIEVLATAFDVSWFYRGMGNFKLPTLCSIIPRAIGIIFIFCFVLNTDDTVIYALCYVVPIMAGNLLLLIKIPSYVSIKHVQIKCGKHIAPISALFLPQIVIELYTVLDKVMLGALADSISEAGFYEQAQKLVKVWLRFTISLSGIMLTRVSYALSKGDKETSTDHWKLSFRFLGFIGFPMVFGLAGIAYWFVPLFFGAEFENAVPLAIIMSPIILIVGITNTIGHQYLLPMKKHKVFTGSVSCGAVVNLLLNLILIPLYGAIGACVATLCAELTVACVQIFFSKSELHFIYYLRSTVKYIVASVIMLALIITLGHIIDSGFERLAAQLTCGVITYFVLIIIMKDTFVMRLLKTSLNSIRRNEETSE